MKKFSKFASIALAAVMSASMVTLAGCGPKGGGADWSKYDDEEAYPTITTPSEGPLTEEKKELSVWLMWTNAYVADPNTLESTKYLEELTNVHIDWMTVDATTVDERFQTMQSMDPLPDIIVLPSMYTPYDVGIEDGWLGDMSHLLKFMPNYRNYLETHPKEAAVLMSDDGVIRCYANVAGNDSGYQGEKQWAGLTVREDMVIAAGYTDPSDPTKMGPLETISDYYNMLKQCKQYYGSSLSAPLFITANGYGTTGSFLTAYGVGPGLYNDNGTVKYGPAEAGYGAYLEEMHKWYTEGLIDPNFEQVSGLEPYMAPADVVGTNASVCYTMIYNGVGTLGPMTLGLTSAEQGGLSAKITPVVNPVLNRGEDPVIGVPGTGSGGYSQTGLVYISPDCKDPVLAAQWLDFMLSEKAMLATHYGKEGVHYTVDESPDAKYKYVYTEAYNTTEKRQDKLSTVGVGYYNWATGYQTTEASMALLNATLFGGALKDTFQDQLDAMDVWEGQKLLDFMQFVKLTPEEQTQIATINTDLATYVSEYTVGYIKGTVTTPFADFVSNMKNNMQLGKLIEVYQNALDRFLAKQEA